MSKLILPKATTSAREAATPVEGDIFYDQNNKKLYSRSSITVTARPPPAKFTLCRVPLLRDMAAILIGQK